MSKSVMFFKSKSCPNCKQVEPVFNETIKHYKDNISATTVDITEDVQKAIDNGVMSVPTLIFFKDDIEVKRLTGVVPKDKIIQVIEGL
ncbi:MAG TPA: thioredoxin [bacterium]|nr:thioredoxin [bacterium]